MKPEVIYIKIDQDSKVTNKKITLQDVAEICCSDEKIAKEAEEIVLYTIKGEETQKLIFSSMKVISLLQKLRPELTIEHIGEPEFVVEYQKPGPKHAFLEYLKVFFLFCVVFFGSAFTIMTFNTDVSVGNVFQKVYRLVIGEKQTAGSVLEIAYSAGIGIGVLGFYNHLRWRQVHNDPTPIHIEMRNYEEEMNNAIIKDASRKGEIKK